MQGAIQDYQLLPGSSERGRKGGRGRGSGEGGGGIRCVPNTILYVPIRSSMTSRKGNQLQKYRQKNLHYSRDLDQGKSFFLSSQTVEPNRLTAYDTFYLCDENIAHNQCMQFFFLFCFLFFFCVLHFLEYM